MNDKQRSAIAKMKVVRTMLEEAIACAQQLESQHPYNMLASMHNHLDYLQNQ